VLHLGFVTLAESRPVQREHPVVKGEQFDDWLVGEAGRTYTTTVEQ
jgi:hypothetical protein